MSVNADNKTTLHIHRDLKVKSPYVEKNNFKTLKMFYSQLKASDEQQLVLNRGANETK
jgi:hypothetical protein